jgi:preprotein translocase subunit YajC
VSFLVVMVLLLVVMWVLMIRPQRQRQREHQAMIDAAGEGDDILTTGGIYGTIAEADGDDLVVELAEGLSVHMTRRGIAAVLPPEEEDEVDDEELVEAEGDLDELEPAGEHEAAAEPEPASDGLRERTHEDAARP